MEFRILQGGNLRRLNTHSKSYEQNIPKRTPATIYVNCDDLTSRFLQNLLYQQICDEKMGL